jgi:alkylhydroperoxidase family enzyme
VLSARLRELVILRVGYLIDSPYEIAQHTTVAARAGVTAGQVAALAPCAELATGGFEDTELNALDVDLDTHTRITIRQTR